MSIKTNDDCTSHDKISEEKVSYKHVNFCGEHRPCERMQFMDDKFCKKHRHDKTKWWLKILDDYAKNYVLFIPLLVNFAMKLVILIFNACIFMIESWPNIVMT